MAFNYFGISNGEVTSFDGRFFTDYPIGDYLSDAGKIFSVERQRHIMSIIHGEFNLVQCHAHPEKNVLNIVILFSCTGTYYLSIVFCQAMHIWTCRTMYISLFDHGVFSNEMTNYGVLISIALGV